MTTWRQVNEMDSWNPDEIHITPKINVAMVHLKNGDNVSAVFPAWMAPKDDQWTPKRERFLLWYLRWVNLKQKVFGY